VEIAMSLTGNWNYPTAVRFGPGRIVELPDICRELGMSKPLLVTDEGLAGLDITQRTLTILREGGMAAGIFGGVHANPVGPDVDAGVAAYKAGGHDGVIAFGGGSALDVGKAVGLMAGQTRPLWDFEDKADWWTRVDASAMAPVVAVPTTSGTGSEVGRCSVIVNEAESRKVVVFHPGVMPARVLADPELTIGLPARITAGTGMDALAHNLEAFCAPGFHPQADGIALEGMALVYRALRRTVADGADIEARSWMMAASLMGATSFQKGLGAIHSLSHPVGAHLHTHHGLTNAVFMPYVLVHNRSAIEARMELLARYLGLPKSGFDGVLHWINDLRVAVGIPHSADALGLTEELAHQLAPEALADPTAGTNPVPLTVEALQGLYLKALSGDV
jgi:alcohol dehydrogenase class IV